MHKDYKDGCICGREPCTCSSDTCSCGCEPCVCDCKTTTACDLDNNCYFSKGKTCFQAREDLAKRLAKLEREVKSMGVRNPFARDRHTIKQGNETISYMPNVRVSGIAPPTAIEQIGFNAVASKVFPLTFTDGLFVIEGKPTTNAVFNGLVVGVDKKGNLYHSNNGNNNFFNAFPALAVLFHRGVDQGFTEELGNCTAIYSRNDGAIFVITAESTINAINIMQADNVRNGYIISTEDVVIDKGLDVNNNVDGRRWSWFLYSAEYCLTDIERSLGQFVLLAYPASSLVGNVFYKHETYDREYLDYIHSFIQVPKYVNAGIHFAYESLNSGSPVGSQLPLTSNATKISSRVMRGCKLIITPSIVGPGVIEVRALVPYMDKVNITRGFNWTDGVASNDPDLYPYSTYNTFGQSTAFFIVTEDSDFDFSQYYPIGKKLEERPRPSSTIQTQYILGFNAFAGQYTGSTGSSVPPGYAIEPKNYRRITKNGVVSKDAIFTYHAQTPNKSGRERNALCDGFLTPPILLTSNLDDAITSYAANLQTAFEFKVAPGRLFSTNPIDINWPADDKVIEFFDYPTTWPLTT